MELGFFPIYIMNFSQNYNGVSYQTPNHPFTVRTKHSIDPIQKAVWRHLAAESPK